MSKTTFLYHANAVGASGHISLPVVDAMPVQASIAAPIGEGHGKVRVENFKHLDYLSIGSIESHVVSALSNNGGAHHATLSAVAIEDLNTLGVVTCDRMMNRLTSRHDKGQDPSKGSYLLHGTHFDNLRIAGYPIELNLAVELLNSLDTWEKLTTEYATNQSIRQQLDDLALFPRDPAQTDRTKLPLHNGVFAITLARPKNLPGGLKEKDHAILIPHFGAVSAAECYITPYSRRMRMLHVDLGCSTEGCNGYGDTGGGGTPLPGSS